MRMMLIAALTLFAAAQAVAQSSPPSPPGERPREEQQGAVPDTCQGDACDDIGEPTGTGFGDRGIKRGARDPHDLGDSPVRGGPPIEGPTGRPLDLPAPGRDITKP